MSEGEELQQSVEYDAAPDEVVRDASWYLAKIVGRVFHPVFIGTPVAVIASLEHEGGFTPRLLTVGIVVGFICVALPLLLLVGLYMTGKLGDDDRFGKRENRVYLYPAALLSLGASFALFRFWYEFPLAQLMVAVAIAVTLLMFLVNGVLKVSIHCAGTGGIAVAATAVYGEPAAALFIFLPLTAWARLRTRAHTPAETVVGSILGVGGAAACIWAVLQLGWWPAA